jgi:hypothetical protein
MVAFDCLVDSLKIKKVVADDQQRVANKINSLIQLIDTTM